MTIHRTWRDVAAVVTAGLVAATLAGCATGYKANSPEAAVKKRADARWQALIAGDFDAAYKMTNPGYRQLTSLESFKKRFGGAGSWSDASVVKVDCEPQRCEVTIEVGLRPLVRGRMEEPVSTAIKEIWILEEGQWWQFQKL